MALRWTEHEAAHSGSLFSPRRLALRPSVSSRTRKPLGKPTLRFRYVFCAATRGRRRQIVSDGAEHLGSSQDQTNLRAFPGPNGKRGPPLRVLPIGGLGEIGMNCMLVGVYDRFILLDAGLMFPDFSDVGMQKILPDTAFISQWKDKIEAVVITHGHEDHIGAIPWVLPALDPATPVFTSPFVHQLLQFRLKQYNLWDPARFRIFQMNTPFQLGPFECEALRVTHSIPDCCGLIFRSIHGTILHTGDWKIDEDPVDGRNFDRDTFEKLKKENVTLMMSDSTNVLSPGRSLSESTVRQSLIDKISGYKGDGRILATLFASNLHRVGSLKLAADAAGRKLCFVGRSLESYLNAAVKSGDAPFQPRELIDSAELDDIDPNKVMVVTTGSQAEPQAALSLASNDSSSKIQLAPDDLIVYSAKVIPGNEKRVMKMMNRIARRGPKIEMRRTDNLHASGHGYREELAEVINLVQPQHFLPVHGESVFMQAHAELAQELGVQHTSVIHDGEMLGVKSLRSRRSVSSNSMQVLGDVELVRYYNDGNRGTGTFDEMEISRRQKLGTNGVIVVSVDVQRPPRIVEMIGNGDQEDSLPGLRGRVRLSLRGIWTDKGSLTRELFRLTQATLSKTSADASCGAIDRGIRQGLRKYCRKFNHINPEVVVVVHEHDPRIAAALSAAKGNEQEPRGRSRRTSTSATEIPPNRQATRSRSTSTRRTQEEPEAAMSEDSEEETDTVVPRDERSIEDLLMEAPNGVAEDLDSTEDSQETPTPKKTKQKSSTASATTKTGRRRGRPRKNPVAVTTEASDAPNGVKSKVESPSTDAEATSEGTPEEAETPKPKKRSGRRKKDATEELSPGELQVAPEALLEAHKKNNPRENPIPGADLEYG